MSSLFKVAELTRSGLKVLVFGKSGVGKSTFGLSFPEIVAIDTEDGLAWYKDNPNLKKILNTTSADTVEEALEEIEDELLDEMQTFVVDSETKIYENMQLSGLEVAERRARTKGQDVNDANISQREWGKIKLITKRIQSSKIMLASKGKNIISVAQEKDLKENRAGNWVTVGYIPDTGKGLDYDYDIVIRLTADEDENGNVQYKGHIRKDRTGVTKRGQTVDNPSFEIWREIFEESATKKEDVKDFASDIGRDQKKMTSELKTMEELTDKFKEKMKVLKPEGQSKVKKKLQDVGIDNPLQTDDADGLESVLEYIEEISK